MYLNQKLRHLVTWKITNSRKLFITLFASAIIGLNMAYFSCFIFILLYIYGNAEEVAIGIKL